MQGTAVLLTMQGTAVCYSLCRVQLSVTRYAGTAVCYSLCKVTAICYSLCRVQLLLAMQSTAVCHSLFRVQLSVTHYTTYSCLLLIIQGTLTLKCTFIMILVAAVGRKVIDGEMKELLIGETEAFTSVNTDPQFALDSDAVKV